MPRNYQVTLTERFTDMKKQRCLKTLICTEYISENATQIQSHAILPLSILSIQPVNILMSIIMMYDDF